MTRTRKPLRLALIGWGAINRRIAERTAAEDAADDERRRREGEDC